MYDIELIAPKKVGKHMKDFAFPAMRIQKSMHKVRDGEKSRSKLAERSTIYFYKSAIDLIEMEEKDRIWLLYFKIDNGLALHILPDESAQKGYTVYGDAKKLLRTSVSGIFNNPNIKDGIYEILIKPKYHEGLKLIYYDLKYIQP